MTYDETDPQIDLVRWETLKNRLADETGRGITLTRIGNEIGASEEELQSWLEQAKWCWTMRRIGEPSRAERIERGLAAHFDELDQQRADARRRDPGFTDTSVMLTLREAFETARTMTVMADIAVPPGAGKTRSMHAYLARCRKEEGFDCPVWHISLNEWGLTPRSILCQIAESVKHRRDHLPGNDEYTLSRWIAEKTEGRRGLLIIDEAQHLADAKLDHGVRTLNGLRSFVDRGLFGIALLNNGEIYRRLSGSKQAYAQLLSRMSNWRVESAGVTEHDIDLIMAAWGVSGRAERAWCIKAGLGPGQMRAVIEAFRRSSDKYGVIDITTLTAGRGG